MSSKRTASLILLMAVCAMTTGLAVTLPAQTDPARPTFLDHRPIRFSPGDVRLPADENEMSRRYLKMCEKWIPIGDEELQGLAGAAQLRPLLRRRLLVRPRDRRSRRP